VGRNRRRIPEDEHDIADSELNLVPYLDIMVNLIMFMLLTFQVVLELKIIQFNPPASGAGGASADAPDEKPLLLTVMITGSGLRILTDNADAGAETIPMVDGKYDYAKLSENLRRLKFDSGLKIDENLIIVAEPQIDYDTVVATLDAARATKDEKELFPHVTLGMAVGTQ
jgi:biopolymer transport protein TolR